MWHVFKTLSFPSHCFLWTSFNPKPFFTQTPSLSSLFSAFPTSRYVFSKPFSSCFSEIMQKFKFGFKNWGFSKIGLGFLVFVKNFQNLLLGWVPFDVCVSVLAPWGNLMYWGRFLHVHALFIVGIHCCMLGVWQNVLVTFLCWIGLN